MPLLATASLVIGPCCTCVPRSGCSVAKSEPHILGDLVLPVELDDRGQTLSRVDHFVAGKEPGRIIIHLALGAAAYLDLLNLCQGALMASIAGHFYLTSLGATLPPVALDVASPLFELEVRVFEGLVGLDLNIRYNVFATFFAHTCFLSSLYVPVWFKYALSILHRPHIRVESH